MLSKFEKEMSCFSWWSFGYVSGALARRKLTLAVGGKLPDAYIVRDFGVWSVTLKRCAVVGVHDDF